MSIEIERILIHGDEEIVGAKPMSPKELSR